MSFLNILGGVGTGLQQGAQFAQQKKMQDEQLNMAQERQDWLRQDNTQKTADRELTNWMDQQYRDVYAREDLDDMGKAFEYAQVIAPRAKREHLDIANKTASGLYQTFGRDAIEAMARGDLSLLQKAADVKAPGTKIATDAKGDNIIVETPDGILQQIDRRGLLTNLALSDVYRTMQAEAADKAAKQSEAQSKIRKTDSEVVLNEAKALNQMAQTNGRAQFIDDENGNLVPNPNYRATGKAGKVQQPDNGLMSIEDFGKAAKPFVADGAEFDMARAYSLYTNMLENTRIMGGQPMSAGQRAAAFEDAIRLARGEGIQAPDLRDGRLSLTANIDGRRYVLDPDYTETQALALKDAKGNPRYTAKDFDDIYLDAMRSGAVSNPQQFGVVWQMVNDPEMLAEARQRFAQGDVRMGDMLRAAEVVKRGIARANETAKINDRSAFSRIFNGPEAPPEAPAESKRSSPFADRMLPG